MKRSPQRYLIFAAGFLILLNLSVSSQGTTRAEREAMYYRYLGFASKIRGGAIQPSWMRDGNSFWYAEGFPDKTVIWKVDPKAGTKEPLFDTARLRQALAPFLGHEPPYQGLPFKEFAFVQDEANVKFQVEDREFVCKLDSYVITPVSPPSEAEKGRITPRLVRKGIMAGTPDVYEQLSPDGRWFLGTKDHNLYLRSTYDGRSEPLTSCGLLDIEWDVEGSAWAPDSLKIGVFKIDQRKVPLLPLVHWLKQKEEVEWVHFTKAGGPMPLLELYIIDILSKEQVRVDLGDETIHNLSILGWNSTGSELYIGKSDREQKRQDLVAVNPETGETRVILTETQKTFVTQLGLRSSLFTLLKDGSRFIWISERDGWANLYLYDISGKLLKQLTTGTFPVLGVVAVDEDAGWVYFTAHAEERLYDTHLYRVDFKGQGFERLTEATGQHAVAFAPSKGFFLDTHSTVARPAVVELRNSAGTLLLTLSEADREGLKDLNWNPPEEFVVKADDGVTDLYGVIYKPWDFDPGRKYPVLDHIYNGPQTTWVPRTFESGRTVWPQALSQLGFIVFIVDGRGTIERGKAFQDVVYGNFGRNEIPDHVAVLKQLAAERPYMDLDRVGIFGGSFGGYMTVRAMVMAPEVYHVGVSIYPVVDLLDLMASAIEIFMGLPENNREGYEYGSSLRLADQLKGKLLLIHGTSDVNATFSASMKMSEALIRAKKPFDLLVMPEMDHSFQGKNGQYAMDAVRQYFQEHLKPENN